MAACLVVDEAALQLFRFLSPNTGRCTLRSPVKSFVCFVREVEVVTVVVTVRVFLASAFRGAEEDVGEEEEEEGSKVVDCLGGRGSEVEAVVVFGGSLGGALLRCVVSCFPVDPPPFCDVLCLTTFSSSIWVSAVP